MVKLSGRSNGKREGQDLPCKRSNGTSGGLRLLDCTIPFAVTYVFPSGIHFSTDGYAYSCIDGLADYFAEQFLVLILDAVDCQLIVQYRVKVFYNTK